MLMCSVNIYRTPFLVTDVKATITSIDVTLCGRIKAILSCVDRCYTNVADGMAMVAHVVLFEFGSIVVILKGGRS